MYYKNDLFYSVLFIFQKNELLLGTLEGCLYVHKGSDPKPWRKCGELGKVKIEISVE